MHLPGKTPIDKDALVDVKNTKQKLRKSIGIG
jgi:hypothetical protein